MTTEQPKSPPTTEQPAICPGPPPPHFIGGAIPPLPPGYPPFFTYPPPAEGQQPDSNGSTAPPYPLLYPPGMVYAFPQAPPAAPPAQPTTPRPKRKQVKMACTNCAAASKRCDENRPCNRCQKYGTADSCMDGQRKERKKGIKRGPYKRKNKPQTVESAYGVIPPPEAGEWPQGVPPPNAAGAAPIYAVAQFPPPEGYYPVFYPPPTAYPPPPDGQPNADGSQNNGQPPPPIMPFYIPGFPPFPYPPPPGTVFQFPPPGIVAHPPTASQPATGAAESEQEHQAERKDEEATCVNPADLSDAAAADSHSKGHDGDANKTDEDENVEDGSQA